jgi:hypothetical protein
MVQMQKANMRNNGPSCMHIEVLHCTGQERQRRVSGVPLLQRVFMHAVENEAEVSQVKWQLGQRRNVSHAWIHG